MPPQASTHVLRGTLTVQDFRSAVTDGVAEKNGFPTLSASVYNRSARLKAQLDFLNAVKAGRALDCSTGLSGGYDDIVQGANIAVTDGAGSVIAAGSLGRGQMTIAGCRFTYSIEVADAPFYQITISNRGRLTYSRQQLEATSWSVASSL